MGLPIALMVLSLGATADGPTAEQVAFFEAKIRPVLAAHCYQCHAVDAPKGIKGGLAVDTRAGLLLGGDGGAAVVPGDLAASRLIAAVRYQDEDLQMPPKGKLPAEAIADLERWVTMGAPDPRDGLAAAPPKKAIDVEAGRRFWSFQPPRPAEPPAVRDAAWPRTAIDRFLLAGLEAKGLKPVGDADRRTLIRRVSFDLVGLPPSPEQVAAFLADPAPTPEAFATVVDRLLDSPGFGERWGRHWLDVARFAESSGKEQNLLYPFAWRYRDYVIRSFNADKPYDAFLKEQLAGDLMTGGDATEQAERQIATGYLAIGPKSHNTANPRQFRLDLADEQLDAMSQGMLGLTIACARCHDHKFDPIRQQDYYALAGIFLSTETRYGTAQGVQNRNAAALVDLPRRADVPRGDPLPRAELAALKRQLAGFQKERDDLLAEARAKRDPSVLMATNRFLILTTQIGILERRVSYYEDDGTPKPMAMGVQDRLLPFNAPILARGELDKPGAVVPRGFAEVLCTSEPPAITEGSGRLALADWVASPANPLTARVMANRVWQHLFGRGIVASPDNFGTTGLPPTHPELLDHLAVSFVDGGWSVKSLIRSIVASRAYQMDSAYDAANAAADPDNLALWRMAPRRLEAEAIRDALLSVGGRLEPTPPVGSPVTKAGDGPVNRLRLTPAGGAFILPVFGGPGAGQRPGMGMMGPGGLQIPADPAFRSVYLPALRDQPVEALAAFDLAETSLVTGNRETTTVPAQALMMMNSPVVMRQAAAMAARVADHGGSRDERIAYAFEVAYARPPAADELAAARDFFDEFPRFAVKSAGLGAGANRPAGDLLPGRPGGGQGQGGAMGNPRMQAALFAALVDVPGLNNRDPETAAWIGFCQSLVAAAEFRIVD